MNNKILMSLVAASIAAMAAAPGAIASTNTNNDNNVNNNVNSDTNKDELDNKTNSIIKLQSENTVSADSELKAELQNQVSAILSKKAPVTRMSESISILVENYGNDDGSIKDSIYKELNLGAGPVIDSTTVGTNGPLDRGVLKSYPGAVVCHTACHSACHTACHGSRGWR